MGCHQPHDKHWPSPLSKVKRGERIQDNLLQWWGPAGRGTGTPFSSRRPSSLMDLLSCACDCRDRRKENWRQKQEGVVEQPAVHSGHSQDTEVSHGSSGHCGMQLGLSHLSGTPPRGLPARRADLSNGAEEERTSVQSQNASIRELGTGVAPQGVPKNSSSTPKKASVWTSATPHRAHNWPVSVSQRSSSSSRR